MERQSTEHAEAADLAERAEELAAAIEAGRDVPAGRLLGLPELPPGDVWVDIAGASVLANAAPKTITSWLTRGGPKRNPFPAATRVLYRLYWPASVIRAWRVEQNQTEGG